MVLCDVFDFFRLNFGLMRFVGAVLKLDYCLMLVVRADPKLNHDFAICRNYFVARLRFSAVCRSCFEATL